ncbi:nitroreductase [Raphidiopsis curvata NIES-932]|nr:nitroreductase [Raphidiopsis curvata NIES-932]
MNTLDATEQKRSVKHYDASHGMTEAEIRQLMELALLSPTSFNIQKRITFICRTSTRCCYKSSG